MLVLGLVLTCKIGCKGEQSDASAREHAADVAYGPAYARYEAPPPGPPSAPPQAPASADYVELPRGWELPLMCSRGLPGPGQNVGLQYSGLYFGTETLAEFPSGPPPTEAIERLVARLEQLGEDSPQLVNLFVHPATPVARLQPVTEQILASGRRPVLRVRDSRGRLAKDGFRSIGPVSEHGTVDLQIELGQTTRISKRLQGGDTELLLEVEERGSDAHDQAIIRWRNKGLSRSDLVSFSEPLIIAEPQVTVHEVARVLRLIEGENCKRGDWILFSRLELRLAPAG